MNFQDIVFFDSEIAEDSGKILDIGAVREDSYVHSGKLRDFDEIFSGAKYVCGHNIIRFDLNYFPEIRKTYRHIDTLFLSPLLFPSHPYHALVKDDKLQSGDVNNPLSDAYRARDLFFDELDAFEKLDPNIKNIYVKLLGDKEEFKNFFAFVGFQAQNGDTETMIRSSFRGLMCENTSLDKIIRHYPVELAYALALIRTGDSHSVTPPWLVHTFPKIDETVKYLCNRPCASGCDYCRGRFDIHKMLKRHFGYDSFRLYGGYPLQEEAVRAAVEEKSLLAIFPTGGGKSLTFQLPALMAGEYTHGLTVVISPLQSLMKDQVDNLEGRGISDAVTLNGMLSPVERTEAIERVSSGKASIFYISPEMLRSPTVERLLFSRNIVRFVIDEAHCFSSWGQDFRVDYLYIGDFIRKYQETKSMKTPVPVSCFTATAKKKVISDIQTYFKQKLDIELQVFASFADRPNLFFRCLPLESDEDKYNATRTLLLDRNCPAIVYVSSVKATETLAERLQNDGISALPFNGRMERNIKVENQEAFMSGHVRVIVATSAFGMGVDKPDVGLVIHYQISDSLENYVQEAGRAGRDQHIDADCYILYSEADLDFHFTMLNQTKLSFNEIQQVWKAIKEFTKERTKVICSPLELARKAGWDDTVPMIETRVKTAVSTLEQTGYVERQLNYPKVFATSIMVKNVAQARDRIETCGLFDEKEKERAARIISKLVSTRSRAQAGNDEFESRVDYIADHLGMERETVIDTVNKLRLCGILADMVDMKVILSKNDTMGKAEQALGRFSKLEYFLLSHVGEQEKGYVYKELNSAAEDEGIKSSVTDIRKIFFFWTIKGYLTKGAPAVAPQDESGEGGTPDGKNVATGAPCMSVRRLMDRYNRRMDLCRFLVDYFTKKHAEEKDPVGNESNEIGFSLVGVLNAYREAPNLLFQTGETSLEEMKEALLYLQKTGILKLEGGFLVTYNGMRLNRVADTRSRFRKDDYKPLEEFYTQKIQQIHIVGEYASWLCHDPDGAARFVHDYFGLEYKPFVAKYFGEGRAEQIKRNITPSKYKKLFAGLTGTQKRIIDDADSPFIVVAAGPGSGKTKVLVHKLASLLLLENVKPEQLLMLTFSRAAATEFKRRLYELIGNVTAYVGIKTFHSYAFDLLGRVGNLEDSANVVKDAAEKIRAGEAFAGSITKTVLVIDEAQDMDEDSFSLVRALIEANDGLRVIAVGDDDQNIFEFRNSDSKYFRSFITDDGATCYSMVDNFRSLPCIVSICNWFVRSIPHRLKSDPIVPVKDGRGLVKITRHTSPNMEEALVRELKETYSGGRSCVLTNTNQEALTVLGLLTRYGIRAKLIQAFDSFKLRDLIEVRYFLARIDEGRHDSPMISRELWRSCIDDLKKTYGSSECCAQVVRMLESFEEVNRKMYRTDLEEFIFESRFEDFYPDDKETVCVSTIHKAKGREFASVYMLLKNYSIADDEHKRVLYVGMSRAMDHLYIHTNTDIFERYAGLDTRLLTDRFDYPEPEELILELSFKDVYLDYFKSRRDQILRLRSGMPLYYSDRYLSCFIGGKKVNIAKLSEAKALEIEKYARLGYFVKSAKVGYVVMWKGDNEEETPVVFPEMRLVKFRDVNAAERPNPHVPGAAT